jgi:hypothetical protein
VRVGVGAGAGQWKEQEQEQEQEQGQGAHGTLLVLCTRTIGPAMSYMATRMHKTVDTEYSKVHGNTGRQDR